MCCHHSLCSPLHDDLCIYTIHTHITYNYVIKLVHSRFYSLAEIPNCRVAIASRKDVLDQLLATLTSPTYTYIVSLVASAGLLCLAYRYSRMHTHTVEQLYPHDEIVLLYRHLIRI